MNCINILGNTLRNRIVQFLQIPHVIMSQQTRNTFVLKRRYRLPIYRKGSKHPNMRSRHFVYDLVEDKNMRKRPPLNLILTQYVEGLGDRGDKITMAPFRAYNRLLLPGLAVYDTPENSEKYIVEDSKREASQYSSPYASRTINVLKHLVLSIIMSNDTPWTLEPWHIRSAYRKTGVYLNEDCITMPNHVISGPNHDIENREFYVTITLNKTEKTHVRCRIHHHSNDAQARKAIPVNVNFWKEMSEPIFPEDKAVLDQLPIPYVIEREMKKKIIEDDSF